MKPESERALRGFAALLHQCRRAACLPERVSAVETGRSTSFGSSAHAEQAQRDAADGEAAVAA